MKRTILSALLSFLMAIMAQAQNITVHGTVLSKNDDEPLIGATVLCEATKAGAATTSTEILKSQFRKDRC